MNNMDCLRKEGNDMNRKNIMSIIAASIISIGMLSGCGKASATEPATEQKNESTEVTENTTEIVEDAVDTTEESTDITLEEPSFGLQDFEGLYCRTDTEEIEDYEVTYTHGYLFNGDGTGVSYGQDTVGFTWNETEIHFADSTETYVMEPGKLTVRDIVYDKVKGNFITPNPYDVDVENIENGIYHAYIDSYEINETDNGLTINTEIFTEESYDIVDIHNMAEGDVIFINDVLLPVKSIEQTDSGIININGGVENNGSALIADDESNCFVYAGMDMERSYTRHGMADLTVSDDVKLIDKHDPSEEKEYVGSDAVSTLKKIVEEFPLNRHNCTILVENGAIVEIDRLFTP